ncbi:tetratricopeptide repeat protein [Metabacillus endolithicus]|uniref:Tetratricopeptide repeat protein n=1 Tax=Metabacillus endolithicus TaxID=1535204 RepID=A0ABW5C201_9BACI|nr:tetratricopeptide repeat protein [Metabacillus endolithicus]UPG66237.1 tetratricopeptide repeat protein [Metabacillus endolithicus]
MDNQEQSYLLYQEGLLEFKNKEFQNALNCFIKSNQLSEHSRTYARIYECLLKLGKELEAMPYIKTAYTQNPKQDKVAIQYAESLILEGNSDLAIDILEKILRRNKTYNPARKLLEQISHEIT